MCERVNAPLAHIEFQQFIAFGRARTAVTPPPPPFRRAADKSTFQLTLTRAHGGFILSTSAHLDAIYSIFFSILSLVTAQQTAFTGPIQPLTIE